MRTDGKHPTPIISKPHDTFRILSLGPSVTFGWGANYEDPCINRIVSGLQVQGKRIELLNLGTPAQPICHQLKWLRETGYRHEPDLIVQTVYGEVDLVDTDDIIPDDRPDIKNGHIYPTKNMTLYMRIRSLRAYSAVLFYGLHAYTVLSPVKAPVGDGREFYKNTPSTQGDKPDGCVKR
jgi:hypothetical protein